MAKDITSQVQAPITFAVPKALEEVRKLQEDTTALRRRHRIRIARSKHKALFGQPDPGKSDDWYLAQERPIAEKTHEYYLRRGGTLFRDATGLTADESSPGQAKSPAGDPWALLDERSASLGTSRTNKAALQYFLLNKISFWKAKVDRLLRRLHPGMSRDAQRDWGAQNEIALTTLVSLANALESMPQGRSAKFSPGSSFKPVRKSKSTSVRYAEEGWEAKVLRAVPEKYKLAWALQCATGCRPAELARGVTLLRAEDGSILFRVKGAKVGPASGHEWREITLTADDSAIVKALGSWLTRMSSAKTAFELKDKVNTYCRAIARACKKSFPGINLQKQLSAYSARHQRKADWKSAGLTRDELAKALGHRSTRSAAYYGRYAKRRKSAVKPKAVRASGLVKFRPHPTLQKSTARSTVRSTRASRKPRP
jgi:integrase